MGEERRLRIGGLGEADVVGAQQPHRPLRRARRSGRARRGCRRRGSAARRAGRGHRALAPVGSIVTVSTGRGLTTQTSAELPPRCIAMALASGVAADAGEAAAHHLPAVRGAGEEDAQAHRARHEHPVRVGGRGGEHHRLLPDELGAGGLEPGVERGAAPCRGPAPPSTVVSSASNGRRVESAEPIIIRSRLARTWARSAAWPHHQVAMLGRTSGSPSSARRCAA